uniref:Uncharacterized protein n=1 Tax=uncultured marine virus TaxID=186617 RepID=A0A0F7L800_9VIRU|nr:hypothetical protein [uncultured marine virus]
MYSITSPAPVSRSDGASGLANPPPPSQTAHNSSPASRLAHADAFATDTLLPSPSRTVRTDRLALLGPVSSWIVTVDASTGCCAIRT